MESQNNIDITANELYEKLESWNKDIKKSIDENKKHKKYSLKPKDLLIKFNRMPTPIKDLELIDIKLGSKIYEDEIFLEKDFIAENLRRGESLFYNKSEDSYDYARLGLPKFFDYQKSFLEIGTENKLKERVLGKIIEVSKNEKNVKYFVYLTTKVNGENFQVSYNSKYDCWVIASKNVSIAIRNKEDIEFYKNEKNFEEYYQGNGNIDAMSEKEKKMKEKKDKKKEKKKKKLERIERRKKGKNEENDNQNENEEDEKDDNNENNENKINEEEKNDKMDIKKSKGLKEMLKRFTFSLEFAEIWLKILQEKIINNSNSDLINEFKKELGDHTLIGESVGDKKREHILVYKERDVIFYGIVNNKKLLSENCLPLSNGFDLFKKYNLSYTEISPSQKFDSLEDLCIYINEQFDVIFDKSLQESGEGNVIYLSCEIDGKEYVKGLGKLKTFEYRFLRKVREKCKTVPPPVDRAKIEFEIKKKFNELKKKKEKKKKDKDNEKAEDEEKEMIEKMNKKIENEIKEKNQDRDKRINNIINKMKNESKDLLNEVPKSKFNTDKNLLQEYYDFGEYLINYRAKDLTNYFDVFASFIEIMKEKFKLKVEINDSLINEIRKKFEGLISDNDFKEEGDEDAKE